jgi:hypothetical protein
MSVAKSQLSRPFGVSKPVLSTFSKAPMPLGHQNIIQQGNASLMKKPKSLEEIFDEMMLAARDEPVCQAIEKALQPIFASTHTLVWLHLENRDVLYSPSFSVFAPTSNNLVATGFKSRSAFRVSSQKAHPLYNSQIDGRVVPPNQPLLMLPIFTRDNRGLAVVQFSRKPEKVFVNHEITIASFLVNKFRTYSDFLFVNTPSLWALVKVTHFGKMSFVMVRVLSSLMRIFSCRRAEVWKFEPGIPRALRSDPQHKDAVAVDPGQMGLAGHAMRHTLQINLRSLLDHPDRCDLGRRSQSSAATCAIWRL